MQAFHSKFVVLLAMLCVASVAHSAVAQTYPSKPVRMIVPFPPGGGNDILGRTVGQKLAQVMGQQVIVDNRGGAGGLIGAELAAKAAPDGYTIFLASVGNLAFNPALHVKLPYDPIKDYAPVTMLATSAFIIVINSSVPAKSVKELIELAKAKPGSLNYGSAGVGSSLHLTGEIFKLATGTNLAHVAYKGTAPALTDLIGGQIQIMFSTMPPALPQVKAGKLRALGVSGKQRSAAAPDVPTIADTVPGFEVLNWYGITVPIRTPATIVRKLNQELHTVLKSSEITEAFGAQGLDAAGNTPEQFSAYIKSEIANYAKVVKAANIHAE